MKRTEMNDCKRPKLHLPLALLAGRPAMAPAIHLPPSAPNALRRLVAAMID